jgi:hypothetical protein
MQYVIDAPRDIPAVASPHNVDSTISPISSAPNRYRRPAGDYWERREQRTSTALARDDGRVAQEPALDDAARSIASCRADAANETHVSGPG